MKILVADDDRPARLVLEAILKKAGHEVVATSNGKEAWQAMQGESPPLLAIVDWIMPEMNGLEFCRKVRESESAGLSSTYVILLTGKRQKDDFVTGLDSGADELIRKPFDRDELLARLRSAGRIIKLQSSLATQVKELSQELCKIKELKGN
jgi:DNA-binding response OmpR family regulator